MLQRAQKRCSPTSRCSGLVLGRFSTHFEPKIEGFKPSNPRNICGDGFWAFLGENKLPLGGNALGCVLGELLGFVLGRGRTLEEEEDNGGEEGSFNAKFVFSLSFSIFLSFDGCIYFSTYVLVTFLRV